MARFTGPTERLSRRAGQNLFLKGERSSGPKSAMTRRPYPPGVHGPGKRPRKQSQYGLQLREKQKAKAIYGLLERQFRSYYEQATRATHDTGSKLMEILERRLDNVVFRLGLADSRRQARQYVSHGHVLVNGASVTIPSFQVSPGVTVTLSLDRAVTSADVPLWLRRAETGLGGDILTLPSRDQIPTEIEEQLIIEFYSR
ncbi:30S ribosomal protein S4 [Candidatus Berkelbacteria bacterium]|nr:30S ribosomal protein S4 [Candidatus Berkelbacteria bacterium]